MQRTAPEGKVGSDQERNRAGYLTNHTMSLWTPARMQKKSGTASYLGTEETSCQFMEAAHQKHGARNGWAGLGCTKIT
jgi:hypothetical protein